MKLATVIYNNPLSEWWYESGAAFWFWLVIISIVAFFILVSCLLSFLDWLREWWSERREERNKVDCPECGGSGKYNSEVRARYGDSPFECSRCDGTGKIHKFE